ncbi:MAG TPA: uroporphyrinogen decarboxylase [Pirellulaceae bacterium]|nr:uroporphyrinogen decarboxylase [Pirellulaceae bacterium]
MSENPTNSANFGGLRVAAFESRRSGDMAHLISKSGGVPLVSPSLREVAIAENPAAIEFAHRLITGQVEIVILLTGVGFRHLLTTIERHVDRQRFLDALADIVTICRGPKPVVAMKEVGLTPTHRVPEPNTWRELLATIDAGIPIANQTIGLQEYGKSNASLIAGLEARGARVISVPVYKWELPEDVGPLTENVHKLIAGEIDVVLFTSAHQVVNLLHVAEHLNLGRELRAALRQTVIASVGPTTSEMLQACDLAVDIEPEHPKMGPLVIAAAERAPELIARKRRVSAAIAAAPQLPPLDKNAPWYDSAFMRACRREPAPYTPVWLMRQAGRYMEEYRKVRSGFSFLDLCKRPDLCAEIMITAVNKLKVDAAIIFSDLLPILEPMGLDLEFGPGEGPMIHNPVRDAAGVDRILELNSADQLDFVMETVKQTRRDLDPALPLIGFSGSPFTLASYAIEGGSSRTYLHTKTLMYRDAGAWQALMDRFARAITLYLNAQIAAGAQCVQLFDSWVGCLGPDDYRRYVLPYMEQIIAGLPADVPVINFGTGNPALLPMYTAGFAGRSQNAVVGIDWRVRLDEAWQTVGHDKAVQGNLEPLVLLADQKTIRRRVQEVLDQAGGRAGHIFNLGHGIVQQTPVDNAIALVEMVHELSAR